MKHVLLASVAGLLLAGCTAEDYAYNTYETPAAYPAGYAQAPAYPMAAPAYSTTNYSYNYAKPYPYASTWKGRPYVQGAYTAPTYNNTAYDDARGEWVNGRYVTYRAEPVSYRAEPIAYQSAPGSYRERHWDSYQQRWIYTY